VDPARLESFTLVLNSRFTYDQLAIKVGEQLEVDPTHLRFWTASTATNMPKSPVKRAAGQSLQSILVPPHLSYQNSQLNDALFYEILEMSLSELDTKKPLRVVWIGKGIAQEVCFRIKMWE
jgi:ubiquitin carboxyl-terminal hydrolase 7